MLDFIISNNHPFTVVDEEKFINFCKVLNPNYKMVKSDTIKKRICDRFVTQRTELMNHLQNESSMISGTTDLWTSGNNLSMLALTITWLTRDFGINEVTLGFKELHGEHTGINIANCVYSLLADFRLDNRVRIKFTIQIKIPSVKHSSLC